MLNPSQVAPFLQHQDKYLRRLALYYFQQAHDLSPVTAEDFWKMLDRFGSAQEGTSGWADLWKFPQTESSIARTIKELKSASRNHKSHLEKVVARLSYGLFMRFRDVIEDSPALSSELRKHLTERTKLMELPAEELWDRLLDHAQKMPGQDDANIVWRLIEALSRNPQAAGWAISVLSDPKIDDWRQIVSVDLLGQMRFRPASALIVDKLIANPEGDAMLESTTDALIRIGGDTIVQAIHSKLSQMPWGTRLYSCDVLSGLKLPSAEKELLRQWEANTDSRLSTKYPGALCLTATTEPAALERLRETINKEAWDRTELELDEDVYALFRMTGNQIPELQSWREKLESPARAEAIGKAHDRKFGDLKNVMQQLQSRDVLMPNLRDDEPSFAAPVVAPIKRESAKVGRNDPCPCGSGKKYKKCCGK